jgi:hypothetical protein
MPVGLGPTPSDSPSGQQKKGSTQSVATIPFARASKWHIEQSNTMSGVALGGTQQVYNFPLASYGYLSGILISVTATGGNLTAATAFEDAPWSVLSQIQLSDVNGVPIFQLSGFNAYLAAKYGGYRPYAPDGYGSGTNGSLISETGGFFYSGVSATTGQFKFILPIFLEFGVDGLGCLPNMDASARYNLQLTVANAGTASATGPLYTAITGSTPPSLAITVEVLCRSQPPASDMFGNMNSVAPPAVGTVQYWTAQTASGFVTRMERVRRLRAGEPSLHSSSLTGTLASDM